MPEATRYLLPNDKERRQLERFENSERNARRDKFKEAEDYYEGNQREPLIIEDDEPNDNIIVNVTKQAVDRTLSFLFPDMPALRLTPEVDEETEEEEFLRRSWEWNNGPVMLNNIAYNGALSGHNFVRVLPAKVGELFPRLVNIHPRMIVAYWQADDKDNVLWYEMGWTSGQTDYLIDFVNNQETSNWSIIEYSRPSGGQWTETKNTLWNFPLSPIYHWQHLPNANNFYGRPEASNDQLRLNDGINKVASDINRILRIHAFPKTIGTGFEATAVQPTAVDSFWTIPNADAEIFNLEMQSDLQSSMNMLTYLNDALLMQARVVIMRGTVKDFQRVTNTGIRAVFLDMIAKNILLRWQYGTAIQELSRRMLMVNGMEFLSRPDIIWADPLPEDDTEAINTLAIERGLNIVGHKTASQKRGYVWDEQKAEMQAESKMEFLNPMQAQGAAPAKTDQNEVKR